MAVIQFDRKRRAGKNLTDAAKDLQRSFFGVLCGGGFRNARAGLAISIALCDSKSSLFDVKGSGAAGKPGGALAAKQSVPEATSMPRRRAALARILRKWGYFTCLSVGAPYRPLERSRLSIGRRVSRIAPRCSPLDHS